MSTVGERRTRIKILETTYTDDTIGGQIPIVSEAKETWALVRELTGQRAQEFRSIYNKQPIELEIRYLSYPVTTNNQIVYNGKTCTIHSITTDDRRRITKLIVWASS